MNASQKKNLHIVPLSEDENSKEYEMALLSTTHDSQYKSTWYQTTTKKKFTDCVLEFKQQTFHCHSLVLSQQSGFFRKLFQDKPPTTTHKESSPHPHYNLNNTSLKVVSPKFFTKAMNYIYRGSVRCPDKQEELDLYYVAHLLDLPELKSLYLAYMGTWIRPQDACLIVEEARRKKHWELYDTCIRLIGTSAEMIFQGTSYFNWSEEHFISVLSNSGLQCDEIEIFKAAKKWIDHKTKTMRGKPKHNEKKRLYGIIQEHIRFGSLTADEIYRHVEPLKMIKKEYIHEAYAFHALGGTGMGSGLFAQFFDRNPRMIPRVAGSFKWDPSQKTCHSNLTVSKNGLEVEHTSGSGHSTCIASKGWSAGTHKFRIKILSSNTHWIGIGVAFKSKLTSTLTNDYSYMVGASSANQRYGNTQGNLVSWVHNDVVEVVLKIKGSKADFRMTVVGKTTTDLKTTIQMLPNEKLFPMVNLYSRGNKIALVKK